MWTFALGLVWSSARSIAQEPLTGNLGAHDPSTMILCEGRYYVFTTGRGIPIKVSSDKRQWSSGGTVFPVNAAPAWTTNAVPLFDGTFWAPDIVYVNGRYLLYYSVSSWGSQISAIGLASTPTLDPSSPDYGWTDHGPVIQSRLGDPYNCIDPSVLLDDDGRLWLVFGSYWQGIHIVELNPQTGLRLQPQSPPVRLAWNEQIEAAHLYKRGAYYYLFVNWGTCCSGVDSTYHIRVGRSLSPTGPFRDRNGVNLIQRGGDVFLESTGRFVGPGHAGVYREGDRHWVTFHYYDGLDRGAPKLGMVRLDWSDDGWPEATLDWSAFYSFETDARDQGRLYDGTLVNGARLEPVPDRGRALRLDGNQAHATLPAAVANARTVAFWARWDGGGTWQRFFDFGDGTGRYFLLTPRADNGRMRCALTTDGIPGEIRLDAPFAFPTGSWAHVAVTFEPQRAVLYFNAVPVAIRSNVTVVPWQVQARSNYLGLSQWPDPPYAGWLDSFRIYGRALAPTEIRRLARVHPALAHWYDFGLDLRDQIGTAHPRGLSGVTQTAEGLEFGDGGGSYVELPGGLISVSHPVTIECFARFGTNPPGARLFEFGDVQGGAAVRFVQFFPRTASGTARLSFNYSGAGANLDVGPAFDGQWVHLACVLDPGNGRVVVYTNGQTARVYQGVVPSLLGVGSGSAFLGRSLAGDSPPLYAVVRDFRIYGGRLTDADVQANGRAGAGVAALAVTLAAEVQTDSLRFRWPSYALDYQLEAATSLGGAALWVRLPYAPLLRDDVWELTLSRPVQPQFYRLRR